MRQLVVGLLVICFVWWWSSSGGTPANGAVEGSLHAGAGAPGPNPGSPTGDLTAVLQATKPAAPAATPTASPVTPPVPAPAATAAIDVDSLVARIGQRDAASIGEGWHALATGRAGNEGQRLADALAPAGDDFATMLGALGTDNAFLHSAEGRAAAGRVLAVGLRMPDPEAVAGVSQFLVLCTRGRIEKRDAEPRAFVDDAYRQHLVRVDRWLCDPANVAGARSYTIAKGDSLAAIAKTFRREGIAVEDGTLAVLNRIHNMNAVQVGQKLKIPIDPVVAVLEKRSFALAVMVGDHLLRLYWVGHGENDKTPVTEFLVAEKQPRPEWTAPDGERYPYGHPKNILGEYFIKFRHDRYTGFGAHGTPMPETIGTMSSMGCIRMLAPDIAELFKLLPRGAKVVVRASESVH